MHTTIIFWLSLAVGTTYSIQTNRYSKANKTQMIKWDQDARVTVVSSSCRPSWVLSAHLILAACARDMPRTGLSTSPSEPVAAGKQSC
jgi:hypothetical protein